MMTTQTQPMTIEIEDRIDALVKTLRALRSEMAKQKKASTRAGDVDSGTERSRQAANETAVSCAVEVRRLRHEAHCLAVELGIADMRGDSSYGSSTAPLGAGRDYHIELRRPQS